jgi:hypothetical protein
MYPRVVRMSECPAFVITAIGEAPARRRPDTRNGGDAARAPRLRERRRQRDRSNAVLGLRVDDPEDVLDEVDVAPAEGLQLETADAGQHERQERDPCEFPPRPLLVVCLLDQLVHRAEHGADLGGLKDAPLREREPLEDLPQITEELAREAAFEVALRNGIKAVL